MSEEVQKAQAIPSLLSALYLGIMGTLELLLQYHAHLPATKMVMDFNPLKL